MVLKPKESIIKNIPADVSYCFTINKQEFIKETSLGEELEKDSLFQKFKAKIPPKALEIYEVAGINKLGDLAIFGETNDVLNLAWIGESKKKLKEFIKDNRLHETEYKYFNQVKISDKLFLNYRWPMLVLSNYITTENFDFFDPKVKKLKPNDLLHPATENSLLYGFIIPDRGLMLNYTFIPLYGKAFVCLKKDDKKIEVLFVQPRMKLKGKLGLPEKTPSSHALLSWPIDSQPVSKIKYIPGVVLKSLDRLLSKPVTHLYAEVLDTISTIEEKTQLDFDAEFQGTLKVIENYKTYPGLRLEFIKKTPVNANRFKRRSKPVNLGLDIFKLRFTETASSYTIESDTNSIWVSQQNMPDYYVYANLVTLNTDPFWESFTKTTIKTLQLHAAALGKGSVFVLTLQRE